MMLPMVESLLAEIEETGETMAITRHGKVIARLVTERRKRLTPEAIEAHFRWRAEAAREAEALFTIIAPELVMLELEPLGHPILFLRHRAMIENQQRVKLVKDWLLELFDPTYQPWFREEFVHPRDFERYLPQAPQTVPTRRIVRRAAG